MDEHYGASGRAFCADRGDAHRRLDQAIVRHFSDVPRLSRTRVQRWIEHGQVLVNGSAIRRASNLLSAGDRIEVMAPDAQSSHTVPGREARALDVLYEDHHLIAINKPPGLVVHPAYKHSSGTLLNALIGYTACSITGTGEPRLLQRLDSYTSGVLLASISREAHVRLQKAMQRGEIRKEYLAVVFGRPRRTNGTIDLPLGRDPHDRRRVVVQATGRPSRTRYEKLATSMGLSVLRCELVTGRKHQIRVHLSTSGWPVVGDPTYGDSSRTARIRDVEVAANARGFPRQALHAWRVSFAHPMTNRWLEIVAPLPQDMRTLLQPTFSELFARIDPEAAKDTKME
jgi:23S rRNA pseudouridine1911/1915/1917 synthase